MKIYSHTKHQGRFANDPKFWERRFQVRQGKVYIVGKFLKFFNKYQTEWEDWQDVTVQLRKAQEK